MAAFKSCAGAVWLSFCINLHLAVATHLTQPRPDPSTQFVVDLSTSSTFIRSTSGISWVRKLYGLPSKPCIYKGIISLPFNSGDCYKFDLDFNTNPTGFNFHIANGCGDGWGGTPGCYEVHNYKSSFYVYGKTGSGDSIKLEDVIGSNINSRSEVTIQRGKVEFKNHNEINQTVYDSTLFTSSTLYFSMNRVRDLNRYPTPQRVATGLCRVFIHTC